jgi:hypothetical protein
MPQDPAAQRSPGYWRTVPPGGYDRDEYPMAAGRGSWSADVEYVPSAENRAAGSVVSVKRRHGRASFHREGLPHPRVFHREGSPHPRREKIGPYWAHEFTGTPAPKRETPAYAGVSSR